MGEPAGGPATGAAPSTSSVPDSSVPHSARPPRLPHRRSVLDRDSAGRERDDVLATLAAAPETRVLVLRGQAALVSEAGAHPSLHLVTSAEVPAGAAELEVYLGRAQLGELAAEAMLAEGAAVLAVVVSEEAGDALLASLDAPDARQTPDARLAWRDLRSVNPRLSPVDAALFTEALAIVNWHAAHRFSPRTGQPTVAGKAGWVRVDPADGREVFPRTDPAVIVAVLDADDRILLGSNALWEPNRFSLVAGFVEPGESLEEAVIREVREETGLDVVDPHYLGSQPWPFPASLMLGFTARVAGDPADARADEVEIRAVRWFSRSDFPAVLDEIQLPGPSSIARAIIEHWYGAELSQGR